MNQLPSLRPGDIVHQRTRTIAAPFIRDICNSWGSHDAPVYDPISRVMQIAPPRATSFLASRYFQDMERHGIRWIVFRMEAMDHIHQYDPHLVHEWQNNASNYWRRLEGLPYGRMELARILARSIINVLSLGTSALDWVKPRKGEMYCTRGTIDGMCVPPFMKKACPPGLVDKDFVNPGDIEKVFVYGDSLKVIGTSDPKVVPEIYKIHEKSITS